MPVPPRTIQHLPEEPAKLAFELVADLFPLHETLARHGISRGDLKGLLRNDAFRGMLQEAKRTWRSPMNAAERIKVKAQIATEDGIPALYAMFSDLSMGATARLDAFKQLSTLADAIPKKDNHAASPNFSVTIKFASANRVITLAANQQQPSAIEHDATA